MTMDWLRFPEATIRRGIERLAIPLALIVATAAFSQNPTASSYLPPDGSTKIAGRQPLQIQFGSAVQAGSGNIVIRRSNDNSIFESIPVTSSRVTFGSALLLNGFESGVEEWNLWGEAIRSQDNSRWHSGTGSLKAVTSTPWDQAEGRFASQDWSGFDFIECWVYTEMSGANAHVFTRSGSTDARTDAMALPGPALTQNAWTRISIPMTVVADPSRVNSFGLNFSLAGTYWVDDVVLLRSNSSVVSFLPSSAFALESAYHINIDAGAIKDLSNNDYAGISDATTWNFTTNNKPTDISLASSTVAENLAAHSFVGKISATDPDAGEAFKFYLSSGTGSTDNASFAISNDSLFTNAVFDFEAKSAYSIRLSVEDRRAGYYAKEFAISIANASDRLTWDNASTSGTQTGSGTWGTDNFWSYNGTDLFAWPGSGHAALFAGANGGYSITVSGTQNADSVIFANSGYTLSSGTIAMTGSTPTIVANADATISSSISGAFAKAGTATLTLSGSNSAAQPYTHLAGSVVAASSTSLGAGPVNMNGTGRIVLNNGVDLVNALTITSCDPEIGRGVLESNANANATWSGALNVNANCATGGTVAGSTDMTGSLTITGPINMGGTATVVKQRAGLVVYRGGGNATRFDLQRGTARLGINNGLPPNAALIQSESNTDYQVIVDLNGYNQQFSSLYSLIGTSRSVTNSSGSPSTLTLTGSSDTTYLGNITGKLSLEKTGTGRQTLKGTNNTYSGGTAIRAGTLVIDGSLTSTTPVDVVTGGKLFCNGNIPGYLNVNEGSVQPGTPFAIGALTGTGANFSNGTGSSLGIRVKGTTKPGIDYDRLTLSGNLVLGGASILNLDLSGLTETGTSTGIVQSNGISGTFASVNLLNNPGKATVTVVYKSSSIDVVFLNSPPSFIKGSDQTALEDAGLRTVPGWATAISPGSPAESAQVLGFRVSNDNNALFSAQPAISPDGTLTYTPAADANGSATVSVRLGDDGGTANGSVDSSAVQTFTITVTPVNDAPGFAKGSDQSALQNTSSRTIANWATSISRGPADESGQNVGFRVSNDNNALFSTQPAISATGTLTYTPAPGATGAATILVRLGDNGGSANGGVDSSSVDTFRIVVAPVNQPPSFTKGANQTVPEDAGLRTVPGWATAITKGSPLESSQSVGFRVSNDNNALFSTQPAISAGGTLTYTPAADANGSATVSVRLGDDGGTADGGVDSSATQTFTVAVIAVNDAPGFTKGTDQNVLQNTSSQTIANWATSISSGPANESGQNVGFRVSNDNNALFSAQPAVSASGTLSYTPAANATGIATIFVKLGDDGGTSNGGVDSSAVDSFTIGVGAVNQPPSFTKGTDQSVQEDAGAQTTPWATAISRGPSNESGQSIGFRVSNDNNALFSAQPAISASGTLSYTPAANANGIATISVRLGDNGGTANGGIDSGSATTFTITVAAVNDSPSFAKGSNPSVSRNAPTQTIANWATSISSGPANESGQNVGFRVTNDNNALFSAQPAVSASGTLTFAPAENAIGIATIFVRLGDDGGTANGGIDSSAEASFTIRISPPLNFTLRPDTLRMRPGDTATFSVAAKNGAGDDTTVAATELTWSWTPDLGILESGHVTSLASGSAMVGAFGFGTGDSAWLVVSPLDTVLAPGPDSVVIRVGHGVIATIPPPTTPRRVAIVVVDSIMGNGIAGADTAVKLIGGTTGLDSIRLEIPSALVPAPLRSQYGTPSVYWKDSAGVVHESPARLLSNSSLSIHAVDGRTYWLGYDTLAPVVATTLSGDSIRSGQSIRIDWRLFDNVAETGSYLCLLRAGSATAACSLLVRGDSIHGTVLLAKAQLPLGGRIWMEGRDARALVRNGQRDVVVQLDTLRATAPRTEDRYELVAFPYTSGAGSAHAAFQRQWGPDNPKRWRAFSIDSTDFVEVLDGGRQDAWGRGFWVRTRKANLTSWIFGGWTPPVSDPVQVEIDPGWSMVGNPLGFDVNWRQVRKLSGLDTLAISGPYRFDGSNQSWTLPDTTMSWPAWHGVAVHNSTGHALRLLIPSIPTGEFASRSAHTAPLLRFSVRGSQASDTTARIWGGFDIPASSPLPPSPIALRVFLPPPVGSNTPIPYFTDVRSYANEGSTWTIHVDGLRSLVPLVLDLARSGTDTAIPLWIRDDKSGRWLPFASRMDFAVGDETRRDFQLLAGAVPANPNTSRRFGLHNRGRDLGWSLPDEMGRTRVKIDVFDLRGRKLLGFVDEEMDPGTYARDFELAAPTTRLIVVLSANGRREILQRLWVR